MNNNHSLLTLGACALAGLVTLEQARAQTRAQGPVDAQPQETTLQTVTVTAKRERRVSKGATNLPLEIKHTPQSISSIDKETLRDFGAPGSNDVLRFATGLVVESGTPTAPASRRAASM